VKVTSNWKERLTKQLLDIDLQEYLMQKEQWSMHSFNKICWKRHKTALKRISKAHQSKIAKMCHNLRHTGARHELWYGEEKPCCMCGYHEDWRHVLTCKSLDAELIRADSWSKLRKQMDKWCLPSAMWIAMENGVQHYTLNLLKHDPDKIPPESPSPFGTTFHTPRNRGRLSRDWITCTDHHFQTNWSTIPGQKWITKLMLGLWEHMDRIWTYRNNIYHENNNQQVARYKTEALDRRYEKIWVKHAGLVKRLHAFQTKHVEERQRIGNLSYETKCCWVNLAEKYIIEAASPIRSEMYTLSKFLGARLGVG
jgi:hypothetical protein